MAAVCAACIVVLISSSLLLAQNSAPSAQTARASAKPEAWTPNDMVFMDIADQFRISPDGKWALWVKTSPDVAKDSRATFLMLSSLENGTQVQLTREINDVTQPRWSPDGTRIAFISSHALPEGGAGDPHIWLINPSGGEPWPASSIDSRVRHFEWQDDNAIIFSAPEDPSLTETQIQAKKDDTQGGGDDAHAG